MMTEENRVSVRVAPESPTGARPAARKLVASAHPCDDLIVDMSHTLASAPSFFQGIVEAHILARMEDDTTVTFENVTEKMMDFLVRYASKIGEWDRRIKATQRD